MKCRHGFKIKPVSSTSKEISQDVANIRHLMLVEVIFPFGVSLVDKDQKCFTSSSQSPYTCKHRLCKGFYFNRPAVEAEVKIM